MGERGGGGLLNGGFGIIIPDRSYRCDCNGCVFTTGE